MKVQVVHATVPDEDRARYLKAWAEWSGTLFAMGIQAELLERDERPGEFVELTWFEGGDEAALGDDRLARIAAELEAAAVERSGSLELYHPRRGTATEADD